MTGKSCSKPFVLIALTASMLVAGCGSPTQQDAPEPERDRGEEREELPERDLIEEPPNP
ncbi:hypothetical protein [Aquisalimonas sp.]|uniref:hypothetical protein n=1 Tax=unclassified Aquisalimonas TaxID=2644645 RepID=UPI0025B95036|nr:hypothetical protein [Aquisalimonas sp.]